jgi:carboxylesterase 2
MASKGVVFVNYNYRTGSFGWLVHPQLSEEMYEATGNNNSGNWGLMDQFAALKWVYANIEAFGGDPAKIAVMGQFEGSVTLYYAVNSPLTAGLIHAAIAESGIRDPYNLEAATLAENYHNLTFGYATGVEYLESKNISTIAQLCQLSMNSLIESLAIGPAAAGSSNISASTTTTWTFRTTLDYYAVPDTYINTLKTGSANEVPLITGKTKDESGASTSTNLTVLSYIVDLQTVSTTLPTPTSLLCIQL